MLGGGGITPEIASVKSLAARMSASAGVIVGIVKYLCLKKDRVANLCVTSIGDIDLMASIMIPSIANVETTGSVGSP